MSPLFFVIPIATKNLTSTFIIPCSIPVLSMVEGFDIPTRHCEEQSDAAIYSPVILSCLIVIPSEGVYPEPKGREESIKNAIASIAKQSQNQIINNP